MTLSLMLAEAAIHICHSDNEPPGSSEEAALKMNEPVWQVLLGWRRGGSAFPDGGLQVEMG